LTLAVVLAFLAIAAGAIILAVGNPTGAGPVARLYAFLIIVEFAIDLPVRVLHSGVYATRRVYKPAWSMIVPTVVQLTILGAGFYFYPGAAIIAAIVVSNALGLWITVHFTLEVYRLMGLRPRVGRRNWWRDFPSIPLGLGIETTLSGLSLRLDALLVLALVGFYGTSTRTFDLTAGLTSWQRIDAFQFFYLIMPLFRGTYESAGIFYFDLVRLRSTTATRELQLAFCRRLLWVAPVVALFFWSLSAALGILVMHDVPISFLLALIPLFVLRSLIGVYQIRLFAEGRFGAHLATLGLLAMMLWLVWLNRNPAGDLMQITAAMIVQLIVLINLQHLRDRRDPPLPPLVPLREWTRALAGESGPTAAGTIRIPGSVTPTQKSSVVALMNQMFDGTGHFTYRSPTSLLYYERISGSSGPDRPPAHVALLEKTGAAAAGTTLNNLPVIASPDDQDNLVTVFTGLFDGGIAFDTQTLSGADEMRTLDSAVLAGVVPAALAAQEDGACVVAVSGRLLTPLYRGGTLRKLFVLPADADPSVMRAWREAVRRDG